MRYSELKYKENCSVCREIYTEPVTLPCGHSLCLSCIERTWDWQRERKKRCPECGQRYRKEPQLKTNVTLCNSAKPFLLYKKTGTRPMSAGKSSLCVRLLYVLHTCGYRAPEHVLTVPTPLLGHTNCSLHREISAEIMLVPGLLAYWDWPTHITQYSPCICPSD
ncbi:hypothetical protein XELAEV_18040815mg [Xenopus laevis]|uniref:RING-type domain-containing protein n=1 Tax=Xenopus laevis TaxID=8355 RepID=A0A974CAB6_XENLA|nr:hypothetical protein XELAEV_18040815mg [Xenopus laevis]